MTLRILTFKQLKELENIAQAAKVRLKEITNTGLMHTFIMDLCRSSTPSEGIKFSCHYLDFIKRLKAFNNANIYLHSRLEPYKRFADLIINQVYNTLLDIYSGMNTLNTINRSVRSYPKLMMTFKEWLIKYSNLNDRRKGRNRFENTVLYNIESDKDYKRSLIDFISGMTDYFATVAFHELISF